MTRDHSQKSAIGNWKSAITCIVGPVGSRHGVASAETPVRIRYDAPIQISDFELRIWFASPKPDFNRASTSLTRLQIRNSQFEILPRPRSLMEERFASNELGVGSSPIGGSNIADFQLPIADWSSAPSLVCSCSAETLCKETTPIGNRQLAIGNTKAEVM